MRALVFQNEPSCPLARLEGPMATRGVTPEIVAPSEIRSLEEPRRYDIGDQAGPGRRAITMEGRREVLGMWFQQTEGAKFWMQVLNDLKHRGVQDILICCVDGLTGFPEAIEAIFPQTIVQTCIVHLIRTSLRYVPRRQYDQVTKDLRPIYTASDVDQALEALEAFDQKWGKQLSPVVKAWRENWEYVIPFLAFPPDVRRVIYTTNPIEALNRQLRKAIKTKGHFPNEEAAEKLIYLAIMNATPRWTKVAGWTKALLAFKIQFGDRLPD